MTTSSIVSIDTQIAGIFDDGSDFGAVRTFPTHSNSRCMSFKGGFVGNTVAGGATVTHQNFSTNEDVHGNSSIMNISVPANTPTAAARVVIVFYGKSFGIRFRNTSTTPKFSVSVDGQAVTVDPENTYITKHAFSVTPQDGDVFVITHDELDDGMHIAVIHFASTTTTTSAILYGYLVEEGNGYNERVRKVGPNVSTLTSTAVAFISSVTLTINYWVQVVYTNTSTTLTVTVEVRRSGTLCWNLVLAPGQSIAIGSGFPTDPSSWTHQCKDSAHNNLVTAVIFGGNG